MIAPKAASTSCLTAGFSAHVLEAHKPGELSTSRTQIGPALIGPVVPGA